MLRIMRLFKNNLWFAHTNRKMLDEMANHASRIRRYMERYGQDVVEDFVDACLTLDNLIDVHAAGVRRRPWPYELDEEDDFEPEASVQVGRMKAKDYMDPYINPAEYLAEQQQREQEAREQLRKVPPEPERDVLFFLMEHAPLENWQRDVLGIVREDAYYFAPQGQTKILNEGWATFVHSHLMTQQLLQPDEVVDYAEHHSGTVATNGGRLNPYKLGFELLKDIVDRWDRGAFGPQYEACNDRKTRRQWDQGLGQGMEKVFEVRRVCNDIAFIDTFLTEEFARDHKLFVFAYNEAHEQYEIASREFEKIKRRLLFQLTNFGNPLIDVVDANYQNRGELYLQHQHEGIDLDEPYARETLKNLYSIWSRPVYLETYAAEKEKRIRYSHDATGAKKHRI